MTRQHEQCPRCRSLRTAHVDDPEDHADKEGLLLSAALRCDDCGALFIEYYRWLPEKVEIDEEQSPEMWDR